MFFAIILKKYKFRIKKDSRYYEKSFILYL